MAVLATVKTNREIGATSSIKKIKEYYLTLAECYTKIINNEIIYCQKCDSWKSSDDFYNHPEYESGKFPICKDCLRKMAEQRVNDDDEPRETEESVKEVLHCMNLPFHTDFYYTKVKAANTSGNKGAGKFDKLKRTYSKSPFVAYMSAIQSNKMFEGETWKDSDLDAFNDEAAKTTNIKKETIKRFGKAYSSEELIFLQNEYDDWVRRYECNTKAQEECFQRLAVTKLEISRASKKGASTKELEATYKTWMDSANVTPRQNMADTTSQAQTFGTLIQKFEMEKPIPEPDPELKDVDKVIKLMDVVLGHTCKAAGIQTGYNASYEKFMKDYTVEKQEYQEDDVNGEIYSQLFGGDD